MTQHLPALSESQLQAELKALGQPAFRARQILQWVWEKNVLSFADMTNLPAGLRDKLSEEFTILSGRVAERCDADDGVTKLLLHLPDGERIETVMIPADARRTACLSTQAGCALGCTFCASGLTGLGRNLTPGEILEQILQLRLACGERISHAVIMGSGEPLANYDATLAAIHGLIDPLRAGISARRITLSTIGLPAQIRRLANEKLPITLAISLHAPTDDLRHRIIPGARGVRIADIVSAARYFFDQLGREVTLEYILIANVNDSLACADGLADIARQLRCNVNLIRYNPVSELNYQPPSERVVRSFRERLAVRGVNVQVRASRGQQADAACGQLRRRSLNF